MENTTIENTTDVIEDINEETLLSLDENLELDQEQTEIAEAKCKKEGEDMEDESDEESSDDSEEDEEMTEAEVSSDEEFMTYAKQVLKAAHGDKYDEEKAMKTAKGILDKAKGDYGSAIGMLTSGLGEQSDEESDEKEMKEAIKKRKFKKLTKKEFIKRIKSLKRFKKEEYDDDDEELSQEEEDAWEAAEAVSDHFTYDSSEMPIAKFKKYAYKFVHIMDDGVRPLSTFKSMSDEKLVAEVEYILSLGIEFDKSPKYGARVIIDEEVDSSDISRLVESEEGLTEEFKEKATTIFEAAVKSKIKETEETLKESYAAVLIEEVETIKEELVDKIDNYLTYAVESWAAENAVAIESGLRTEIAENFIQSLKAVFVENYIEVPEAKKDLVAEMESTIAKLQEEATDTVENISMLSERVEKLTREKIVAEASTDLADTQVEKLKSLVEDVNYTSESAYRKKVETIKEFYLKGILDETETLVEETTDESSYITTETVVENETIAEETVSPAMQKYLTALSRLSKANEATVPTQG